MNKNIGLQDMYKIFAKENQKARFWFESNNIRFVLIKRRAGDAIVTINLNTGKFNYYVSASDLSHESRNAVAIATDRFMYEELRQILDTLAMSEISGEKK